MKVIVLFQNGSEARIACINLFAAYEVANSHVSHNPTTVARIEVDTGDGIRALWDSNWTPESNAAGLRMPL
jgi:hypothetical protein